MKGLAAVIDNLISVVMIYRKHFSKFLDYCVKNYWYFINDLTVKVHSQSVLLFWKLDGIHGLTVVVFCYWTTYINN